MERADNLQVRIMKELMSPGSFQWNVRQSYARIAEKLGVDEETVRNRIARAQKTGFLGGWRPVLNPHLIGRESAGIDLEVNDETGKPNAISQIKLIDGVVFVLEFHGKGLQVLLYYENEQDLARKIQLITSICRSKDPVYWKGGLPPCELNLKKTDWEIVKALRRDARRSPSDVGREVGVSTRTVKRRLTLMTNGRAFFVLLLLDFGKAQGVNCRFIIFGEDENSKNTLDKQVMSRLSVFFSHTTTKNLSVYSAVFSNLSEAEDALQWIKRLDGVKEARMGIMKEFTLVNEWLDQEIEKRLAETS